MMIAFTYLPAFVTLVFRSMPNVWRGCHRLLLCWLVFLQGFLGLRFVLLMAAWDGYCVPVGFRLILHKRHADYRTENALFSEMVWEFVPPGWAKLVIAGGDAAYGSKANMRMVQDRDKADVARRWGFVFAVSVVHLMKKRS